MELDKLVDFSKAFVIYKMPKAGKLHVVQQQNDTLFIADDFKENGFYFAPFDMESHPTIFFPDKHTTKNAYLIRDFSITKSSPLLKIELDASVSSQHIEKVEKAIEIIRQNVLKKIVISRKQLVKSERLSLFNALLNLMNAYENSWVYLWHHPSIGTWMGASPELLLAYKDNQLQTMALAGTLPVVANKPVEWSQKEIREQQIVTDDIVNKLSKFLANIEIFTPRTIYQGKIAHIQTQIAAKTEVDKISEVIRQLHPTPAVCGMPTSIAKQKIREIEQYDRKYYTGFLGFKDELTASFFVNLRCMEIERGQLNLYVGGGIVADSVPQKEYKETQYKSQILLDILSSVC